MWRPLTAIEQAFALSNRHYPLGIVVVLHLRNGPDRERVATSLRELQLRYEWLRASIVKESTGFCFVETDPPRSISLESVERTDRSHWQREAEVWLNQSFPEEGPALRARYLTTKDEAEGELLLAFHHSFVDSVVLRLLLDDLLNLLGELPLSSAPNPVPAGRLSPLRPGWKLASFLARQLADEWRFARQGRIRPIPGDSRNELIDLVLPLDESRRLQLAVGRKGLTLHAVLQAVILLALIRRRQIPQQGGLFRSIAFADLRPQLDPPPPPASFGCYISMLRLTLPIGPGDRLDKVARELLRRLYRSGKRGELQLFAALSKPLIQMALRLQKTRLGHTALSFMGPLDLHSRYGRVELREVSAYITNNRLGPEFSGFGKLLSGRLGLHFTYLAEETSREEAADLVADIRRQLLEFS